MHKFKLKFAKNSEEALKKEYFPTPEQVVATELEKLREIGLSYRKGEYIRNVSQKFIDGELSAEKILASDDDTLYEMLLAVKGLGPWSVEMLLMSTLKRPDVTSPTDLSLQRSLARFIDHKSSGNTAKKGKFKYISESEFLNAMEPWRPYRTIASWYIWKFDSVKDPM